MQVYPVLLIAFIKRSPESPRWFVYYDRKKDARQALEDIYGRDEGKAKYDELLESHEKEEDMHVGYKDMFTPGHPQFHPTIVTIMG